MPVPVNRRGFLCFLLGLPLVRLWTWPLPTPGMTAILADAPRRVLLLRGGVTVGSFATFAAAMAAAKEGDTVLLPPGPGEGIVFPLEFPARLTIRCARP